MILDGYGAIALYILQSLYVTPNSLTRVSGRQIFRFCSEYRLSPKTAMLTLLYTDKGRLTLKGLRHRRMCRETGPKPDITLWIMESDSDGTKLGNQLMTRKRVDDAGSPTSGNTIKKGMIPIVCRQLRVNLLFISVTLKRWQIW